MALVISGFLKGNIERVLAEMVSAGKTEASIGGFPMVKVSLARPEFGTVAVMFGSDFPEIKGIRKDQKIYIYQEA